MESGEWRDKDAEELSALHSPLSTNLSGQQALFGIIQGAGHLELRKQSLDLTAEIGFDGYAIGGLSVGEEKSVMYEVLEFLAPQMPSDAPRYLMGVGTPEDLIGSGFARRGYVRLRNADAQRTHRKRIYIKRKIKYPQRQICFGRNAFGRAMSVFGVSEIFAQLSAASLSNGRNVGGNFDFAS